MCLQTHRCSSLNVLCESVYDRGQEYNVRVTQRATLNGKLEHLNICVASLLNAHMSDHE